MNSFNFLVFKYNKLNINLIRIQRLRGEENSLTFINTNPFDYFFKKK